MRQHLEPGACPGDVVCACWNASYGCMILGNPHADLSQKWDGFHFKRAVLVIAAPRGTCLITASRPSLCLHSDQRHQARPSPRKRAVYLDRRPEQDFILISTECDSENITLGCHSAGKRLFRSVNREITSCKKMLFKCWMC